MNVQLGEADSVKSTISGSVSALLLASCFIWFLQSEVRAQCPGGTTEWERADTNVIRCGRAGFVNTNTFYSTAQGQVIESIQTAFGTGTKYDYASTNYTPRFGGFSTTTCNIQETDASYYTDVSEGIIYHYSDPGTCTTDLYGPAYCDQDGGCAVVCPGGNLGVAGTLYNHMLDSYPNCFTTADIVVSNDVANYHWYTGQDCDFSYDYSKLYWLSDPYTLPDFIRDTMSAVRNASWVNDGPSAPFYYLNWDFVGGATLDARLLHYRIKFKTKVGVKYNVKWKLEIDEMHINPYYATNTFIIPNLSQLGIIGNGKEMQTDWHEVPSPNVTQLYAATVIDIQIEPEGGGCSSCGGEDSGTSGDGYDWLGSAAFWISLGAGTVDESAGVL